MRIIIEGSTKEIADLAVQIQERRKEEAAQNIDYFKMAHERAKARCQSSLAKSHS